MTTASGEKPLELSVRNFGPIAEADIELRPLSVFVGPSNTGKSYLATLIYALHQFFGAYAGERGHAGTFSEVKYSMMDDDPELSEQEIRALLRWAKETNQDLESRRHVAFKLPNYELAGEVEAIVHRTLLDTSAYAQDLANELLRCYGVNETARLNRGTSHEPTRFSLLRRADPMTVGDGQVKYYGELTEQGVGFAVDVAPAASLRTKGDGMAHMPLRHFSWPDVSAGSSSEQKNAAVGLLEVLSRSVVSGIVSPLTRSAFYLPASRSGIMRSHDVAVRGLIANASRRVTGQVSSTPALSGVLGDFLERLVGMPNSHPKTTQASNQLPDKMEEDILRGRIRIDRNPAGYPSFFYRPGEWEHDLPLMNTSSMVSELAPVVLYLRHIVQPGETLIIEEPESALHPAMQVEFTRLLAAAVKAGIRIIITTHSEWVLEELANLVLMSELPEERREGIEGAELALSPSEVGAWFFDPSETDDGGTVVKEIPLDKEMGNFPSGFGLITADLYNRYARISNRIERMKEG